MWKILSSAYSYFKLLLHESFFNFEDNATSYLLLLDVTTLIGLAFIFCYRAFMHLPTHWFGECKLVAICVIGKMLTAFLCIDLCVILLC